LFLVCPEVAAQIVLVTVNVTPVYDYTVLSDTLVRVDLPLVPTVRVVIHYLIDLNLDTAPYYTQAQVDAMLPAGSNKTKGTITATYNYPLDEVVLSFDYNEVTSLVGDSYVVLPDTSLIGKEVIVFAKNNSDSIFVQVNQAFPSKLVGGLGGIESSTDLLEIKPNESYRFLSLENDFWYYEKIQSIDWVTDNLQKTIEAGGVYTKTTFSSTVNVDLKGNPDPDNTILDISVNAPNGRNGLSINNYEAGLYGKTNSLHIETYIKASGSVQIGKVKNGFTIELTLDDPTVNANVKIPAKTVAGNYKVVLEPDTTYTVATLPTGVLGDIAIVTDALAPAYAATVVGGGAVTIKVWYNGTNWVCN